MISAGTRFAGVASDPSAACGTLTRDWETAGELLRLPQERWIHLRTTNIAESRFHAVR
jgi:hypothetical protein